MAWRLWTGFVSIVLDNILMVHRHVVGLFSECIERKDI
jgi:hypothetical protein